MVILNARIDCEIFDIDVRLLVIFKAVLNALVELFEEIVEVVIFNVVIVVRKFVVDVVEIVLVVEVVVVGFVVVVVIEQASLKLPFTNIIK
jgi:hypothetical protein